MVTQPYHRFTFEQRKVIQIGVAHRQKATEIAFTLNVNPTSVSRELKRNRLRMPILYAIGPRKRSF